jgi:hypothetical protein
MRATFSPLVEMARERSGDFATDHGEHMGAFKIRCPMSSTWLNIIISDGSDWSELQLPGPPWEHVSVSNVQRCPTWEEMNWVTRLFWDYEECVVQFHPPQNRYVNCHPNCLHLWKPVGVEIPMPPLECV